MDRLWVFQSDRPFTKIEIEQISIIVKQFLIQWNTHGTPLESNLKISYNQFIIIHVNEDKSHVSGCSIDSLMHMIQDLEKKFNLSLLNRMNIAYKEKGTIKTLPLKEFKTAVKEGHISSDTIIFDNTISSLEELNNQWEIPIKNSWLKTLVK
ncbi:MAG: ABC transporter ATPase [Flavobacteriales bacterium]